MALFKKRDKGGVGKTTAAVSRRGIGCKAPRFTSRRGGAKALAASVDSVLVARLELGQTDPRLSTLSKLAEALKLTVGELVDGPTKRAGRKS
ncbi:MAG TPA: helix-turn-helix domain-containing protein [Candidatus Methylomirabilis sp.]